MKKKSLITVLMILFTLVYTEVFANSNISLNNGKEYTGKGFVFTDKLKIRNAPNLQSEKTGILEFGDVITYYEVTGSGEYKDGILDKWVKISSTENQWVNYFYVIPFEVPLDFPCMENIIKNNDSAMNVHDELPNRIFIEDIVTKNSKKYFKFSISDDSYYHKDDYKFEKEVAYVIKNIHPASYKNALQRGAGGKMYRTIEDGYIDMTTENYVAFLPEGAVYDPGKNMYIVSGGGTAKTVEDLDTLVVLDNPSFRKFLLCDYIVSKVHRVAKITDEKTVLDYGVKVGMSVKDLYEIIGKPVFSDNNLLDYFGDDRNATMELKFKVKDGKITEINFEFYK